MRLWRINPDKQKFGRDAWGLLCIRCGRYPAKKRKKMNTFNMDYMQRSCDKTLLSVWWPWQLIQAYLTGVNIAIDAANRAKITTTDMAPGRGSSWQYDIYCLKTLSNNCHPLTQDISMWKLFYVRKQRDKYTAFVWKLEVKTVLACCNVNLAVLSV